MADRHGGDGNDLGLLVHRRSSSFARTASQAVVSMTTSPIGPVPGVEGPVEDVLHVNLDLDPRANPTKAIGECHRLRLADIRVLEHLPDEDTGRDDPLVAEHELA